MIICSKVEKEETPAAELEPLAALPRMPDEEEDEDEDIDLWQVTFE